MPTIIRITDEVPRDFHRLLTASQREGVRNMTLLWERWQDGTERFDGKGEALFGAKSGETLHGLAGVSIEHNLDIRAMRMRRLYVLPAARRQGVAACLARCCMERGFQSAHLLTCNARASAAAGPFWEHMGFARVDWPNITHRARRDDKAVKTS